MSFRTCRFSSPRRSIAGGTCAGATAAEAAAKLPGDTLVPAAQYRSTRAITIDASASEIWPWLVQAGCLRGGFYSDDLLDNLAHPSAITIIPEFQHLEAKVSDGCDDRPSMLSRNQGLRAASRKPIT